MAASRDALKKQLVKAKANVKAQGKAKPVAAPVPLGSSGTEEDEDAEVDMLADDEEVDMLIDDREYESEEGDGVS